MSMTPTDFHTLLDSAVADEPPAGPLAADLAAGRRRLRRRRMLAAAGAAAAVVATAGTVQAVTRGAYPSLPTHMPAAQEGPQGDAGLLRSCRQGNQSDRATAAIFGAGAPVVKAVSRNEHQAILAIESGDGSHWAECFVHLDEQEFGSGMTVYDATGTSRSTSYSSGSGCGLVDGHVDRTCPTFVVSWVDRLPSEVAAVRFGIGDGRSTTVPSRDGYVVLNYQAALPAGVRIDSGGSATGMEPLSRVTYLDRAGDPIAAQAMDGSGSGPDHEDVGDLPHLSAYPALRSDQAIY